MDGFPLSALLLLTITKEKCTVVGAEYVKFNVVSNNGVFEIQFDQPTPISERIFGPRTVPIVAITAATIPRIL